MRALGVVPARGGSKGIPQKNLRPLAGRPLLAYTADAVRGSRRLSGALVSTDDPAIAAAARQCGLDVPFLRPPELAADDTPMLAVLQHVLAHMVGPDEAVDAIVLLQPTSPLRRGEHIDAAIDLLEATGADSVVSVIEVPHQFNPYSVMRLEDGRLHPLMVTPTITRRQDKPPVYARNGPAVLAVRAAIIQRGSLYGEDCRPLVMPSRDSIDIDTPEDFELAGWWLARR